jgi:uncharacterized membrane protein YfcA
MSLALAQIVMFAFFAGLLSGLTGVGGGVIFTPLFKMVCDSRDFSSLAIDSVRLSMLSVFLTNAPSLLFSHKHSFIQWPVVRPYLLPLAFGVICSQFLFVSITPVMHDLMLLFIILHLILLSYLPCLNPFLFLSSPLLIGFFVGFTSGLAGIGGSFLLYPLWQRFSLSFHQIQAHNTLFTVYSSAILLCFAAFTLWQPPIDLIIFFSIVFLATLSNLFFSQLSDKLSELMMKKIYNTFFYLLIIFYALRILSHVYS